MTGRQEVGPMIWFIWTGHVRKESRVKQTGISNANWQSYYSLDSGADQGLFDELINDQAQCILLVHI